MTKKSKIQGIHADIRSGDSDKVLKALKDIREHGTQDSIPVLIDILVNTKDELLYLEAVKILNDLKDKESTPYIIDAIQDPANAEEIITLLQVIWQAGLKVEGHLRFLVDLAMKSDNMVAFECLTILEHMEDSIEDEEAFPLISDLREAVLRKNPNEAFLEMMIQELNERVIG